MDVLVTFFTEIPPGPRSWFLVLPIDKENLYDYREGDYIYIYTYLFVDFLASHFCDRTRCR